MFLKDKIVYFKNFLRLGHVYKHSVDLKKSLAPSYDVFLEPNYSLRTVTLYLSPNVEDPFGGKHRLTLFNSDRLIATYAQTGDSRNLSSLVKEFSELNGLNLQETFVKPIVMPSEVLSKKSF